MLESSISDEYVFKLCSTISELSESYRLRIEVFHEEQQFSKETEVDKYDPVSAHFLLISKKNKNVVATVRLAPYCHMNSQIGEDETSSLEVDSDFPIGEVQSESALIKEFWQAFKSQLLFEETSDTYSGKVKLGRLAVRKTMRGKGLGAAIVKQAEAWLLRVLAVRAGRIGEAGRDAQNLENNCIKDKIQNLIMIVSSQMQAKGFYEKQLYVVQGNSYDEEGAPHILCTKQLSFETLGNKCII